MSGGTLYTYAGNFRAHKAQIAAQYSGRALRLAPGFCFGTTNREPAFLAKFPGGKVPAFEADDGLLLTESNAIAYYVSNETLRGQCPKQSAQIQQWLSWADSEIFPSACAWVYPILGIKDVSNETKKHGEEDTLKSLRLLNNHLLSKTFLVGERITLADIVVFCTLQQVFQYALDKKAAKGLTYVNRWFVTLMNQPEFISVLGEIKLCDQGSSEAEEAPAKTQCPKAAKPAKAQEPKAPKAKAQPKAPEPADEEPEDEFKEAPSKNPFDAMPKGTFVMDNFKKVYSNESETVSIPWFFNNFDAENYSIWFGEYKYSDELAKVFMSCNLITGMFQRLDKMRKQAFASCCLFGKDNDSTISGVWVWRGQELAFPLCPDWQIDYESYSWRKLDFKSPETKALVEQYFAWLGKDKDGREFNQGKIFK